MGLEIVSVAPDAVRPHYHYFSVVLLHQRRPLERLCYGVLSLRRVRQIGAAICRDQREFVFVQDRAHSAVRLHGFNLVAEEFDTVEPEAGDVTDRGFPGLRTPE